MRIFNSLFGHSGTKSDSSPSGSGTPEPSDDSSAGTPATIGADVAWQELEAIQRIPCPVDFIEESQATGEVAEIYDVVKKALQVPQVPNLYKVLANSPPALKGTVAILGKLFMGSSLPQPVIAILIYSISLARSCQYCGSFFRLTCRTVGVDEAMLAAVGNDLGAVTPERVQAIMNFGLKAAMSSSELTDADYDKLREIGISDSEMVEIVALAGLGVYLNIVADALKIDVDDMIKQGLAA
jgi:uncharacterized peroxidase-related enzyme